MEYNILIIGIEEGEYMNTNGKTVLITGITGQQYLV